jgi:hypothetical protein
MNADDMRKLVQPLSVALGAYVRDGSDVNATKVVRSARALADGFQKYHGPPPTPAEMAVMRDELIELRDYLSRPIDEL